MYLIGDHGRDVFIDLKFNYKIHSLPNKFVSILQRSSSVVSIVEHEQINSRRGSSRFETFRYIHRERHFR